MTHQESCEDDWMSALFYFPNVSRTRSIHIGPQLWASSSCVFPVSQRTVIHTEICKIDKSQTRVVISSDVVQRISFLEGYLFSCFYHACKVWSSRTLHKMGSSRGLPCILPCIDLDVTQMLVLHEAATLLDNYLASIHVRVLRDLLASWQRD